MDPKPLLFAALVKAQAQFGPALKNAVNPHFRNKYADLSACYDAVRDALNSNGIAVVQVVNSDDRNVCVETYFLHESGESQGFGVVSLPASKNDAQGYGSSLTYARRYSLMTACSIAPEDDDGEEARKSAPSYAPEPEPRQQAQPPDISGSIDKLVRAFAAIGVTESQVADYCHKPIEKLNNSDVEKLREVYATIKEERAKKAAEKKEGE